MADEIRIEDGPKWDAQVSVRGVTLRLVSPLEIKTDLGLSPIPTKEELDRLFGRRAGVFVRLWRWLFGDPHVDPKSLPSDGGGAHARELCLVMYGTHHADFLATLTTGEIFQLTQYYMGYQERWGEALFAFGAEQAENRYGGGGVKDDRPEAGRSGNEQTAESVHDVVMAAFGPPRRGFATGISGGAPAGPLTLNGQVKFPKGGAS